MPRKNFIVCVSLLFVSALGSPAVRAELQLDREVPVARAVSAAELQLDNAPATLAVPAPPPTQPAVSPEAQINLVPPPPKYDPATVEFFLAVANGDSVALQKGLDAGISPNVTLPQPVPPEIAALFPPRSRGAWAVNSPGLTALMLAVAAGKAETMALLISAKADTELSTRTGLHALDIAAEHGDIPAMQMLLGVTPESEAKKLSIVVDLSSQKAILSRDGVPVLTTKVSSGKKEKPTPRGTYVVTQKYTEWRSTLYHNASMPYFMRLSCGAVGLHQGIVPDYPASHGCVRLPAAMAKKFYAMVPRGTVVEIR
jgi:lipoprotein-anchoring transpeptidase ErfK/SrfK